jgi:hypothetical protein
MDHVKNSEKSEAAKEFAKENVILRQETIYCITTEKSI